MDVLIDTHVAVWWADGVTQLTAPAAAAIADPTATVWLSAASAWELTIKVRSGKLSVDVHKLVEGLVQHGVTLLGIGIDDAISAGSLDWHHRDPFDRMLVAQASRRNLMLITRDRAILDRLPELTIEG